MIRLVRTAEPDGDLSSRAGILRRLTLRHGPDVFLDRWGIELRWFGVYLHHIAAPDPGIDLHDHPWQFLTVVLWGGYDEEVADTRAAARIAARADEYENPARGERRTWRRWSAHRMPFTVAHRIVAVRPRTWTLVVRGRKSRVWGFYMPAWLGWVNQLDYDYAERRPVTESRP